jgi:hypothetical protein
LKALAQFRPLLSMMTIMLGASSRGGRIDQQLIKINADIVVKKINNRY